MLLRLGSENEYVEALIQFLVSNELLDAALIGEDEWDDYTEIVEEAVEDFQESMELTEDGIAGPITLAVMGFEWADYVEGDDIEQEPEVTEEGAELATEDYSEAVMDIVAELLPLWSAKVHDELVESFHGALTLLGPHLHTVHLATPLEWAIFVGQIRQETGAKYRSSENLNYKCTVLPKLFSAYRRSPELAREHGRCDGHSADQRAIAGTAYGGREDLGNTEEGDGSLFMGGGDKQLTGRANYQGYHDWLMETLPDVYQASGGEHIMTEGFDLVSQSPHRVLSAVYFWSDRKLYEAAELGFSRAASDHATSIVNRNTDSYGDRWAHMRKAGQLLGIA